MRIVPQEKTLILRLDVFFAGPGVPTSPQQVLHGNHQFNTPGGGWRGEGGRGGRRKMFIYFFPDVTLVRSMENKDFLRSLIRAKYLMNIFQSAGEVL